MKQSLRHGRTLLLLVPFVVIVVAFELLPLAAMTVDSIRGDGGKGWTVQQYVTALTNRFYLAALQNSVLISFFSSVTGIAVALVAAYSITRFTPKVREKILNISNMTSNFAGVPLAFAYIILLGNNGLFTLLFQRMGWDVLAGFDLYSWTGLAFVYVYFQIPLAVLLLYPTYFGIQEQWKESAALLGATPLQFWLHVGFPIILPGVVGTFSILFANAMGAYATAYALVGSNYNLLSIRIGSLVAGDVLTRPQLASALAVILGATMVGAMWVNERMMRRVRRDLQ
jgi:putative spermidine/putrescine transport system permease protein